RILASQEKLAEAEYMFRKAVAINPADDGARDQLASILRRQGKPDEPPPTIAKGAGNGAPQANPVLSKLADAVRRQPMDPVVRWQYGAALIVHNMLPEALFEIKEALRLNPNLAEPHFQLGLIFTRQQKLEEAEAEFRTAVRLDANLLPARHALVNTLRGLNRT